MAMAQGVMSMTWAETWMAARGSARAGTEAHNAQAENQVVRKTQLIKRTESGFNHRSAVSLEVCLANMGSRVFGFVDPGHGKAPPARESMSWEQILAVSRLSDVSAVQNVECNQVDGAGRSRPTLRRSLAVKHCNP